MEKTDKESSPPSGAGRLIICEIPRIPPTPRKPWSKKRTEKLARAYQAYALKHANDPPVVPDVTTDEIPSRSDDELG